MFARVSRITKILTTATEVFEGQSSAAEQWQTLITRRRRCAQSVSSLLIETSAAGLAVGIAIVKPLIRTLRYPTGVT